MSSAKRKLKLLTALAGLILLATAVSCKGFFVNSPDSLTIVPNPVTFQNVGDSPQLTAQAAFGSTTQDVTNSTTWKSSNGCAVVPSTTQIGQVTAIGTGSSVTITAIYNGVTATATATTPTGIVITPCGTSGKFSSGVAAVPFKASDGGTDVTSTTTWTSDNTSIVNFASSSSGTATFGPMTGPATIKAASGSATGFLQVTVQ